MENLQTIKMKFHKKLTCLGTILEVLKTIKPTRVEAEYAYSEVGFVNTKLRNSTDDKTLNGLITMCQEVYGS